MSEEYSALAQARASLYSLINVHFLVLPDPLFIERIRSAAFRTSLAALSVDSDLSETLTAGASLMLKYIESTLGQDVSVLIQAIGVDRTRLYRGVSPALGLPPPCEAVWTSRESETAALLQELAALYKEDGLALATQERLDYIGVELDYIQRLIQNEIAAWRNAEPERALMLQDKQQRFLDRHLSPWVLQFIKKALPLAATDYYRGHLRMLDGLLKSYMPFL